MSNGPLHPALQALARECGCGWALSAPDALRLSDGDGNELMVQAEDDALVLHARWPCTAHSDGDDEDTRLWTRLLAGNAPMPGRHTPLVHGVDTNRQEILAFARLGHASQQAPGALGHWAQACLAQLKHQPQHSVPAGHSDQAPAFAALWRALDLGELGPGEDLSQPQSWTLVPDSGVPVRLSWLPATGEVLLRAIVSVLPTELDDDAAYFQRLLNAHLLGEETSGSVFAIDEAQAELIVWHREPVALLSGTDLSSLVAHVAALALAFAPGEDNDSRRAVRALG